MPCRQTDWSNGGGDALEYVSRPREEVHDSKPATVSGGPSRRRDDELKGGHLTLRPMSHIRRIKCAISRCRRTLLEAVAIALTALAFLTGALPATAVMTLEDRERFQCVGCHTGNAKTFIDPITGERKETLIDIAGKRAADHADVACRECHVKGFDTFPHFEKKILGCMDCHPREGGGAQEDEPYDFQRIEREFKSTVHFTRHRKKFVCGQCHHPHYFEATAYLGPPQTILETHNEWCLNCHTANPKHPPDTIAGGIADPAEPSLVAEHGWIPHTALHLRKTRCIDCHSGTEHVVSHTLPLGEKAGGCISCHSLDSAHARLYRYVDEVGQAVGFTHPAMMRDSYVMGATRHLPLEILTYCLLGGTLLAVVGHAAMRTVRRLSSNGGDNREGS
jgi:hypothetical protein